MGKLCVLGRTRAGKALLILIVAADIAEKAAGASSSKISGGSCPQNLLVIAMLFGDTAACEAAIAAIYAVFREHRQVTP